VPKGSQDKFRQTGAEWRYAITLPPSPATAASDFGIIQYHTDEKFQES
jgi:hypothetical protein